MTITIHAAYQHRCSTTINTIIHDHQHSDRHHHQKRFVSMCEHLSKPDSPPDNVKCTSRNQKARLLRSHKAAGSSAPQSQLPVKHGEHVMHTRTELKIREARGRSFPRARQAVLFCVFVALFLFVFHLCCYLPYWRPEIKRLVCSAATTATTRPPLQTTLE